MSDDDISIDEKRVYAGAGETTTAFVATGAGVARVEVSDDIVGEFSLVHRGPAVDVAVGDDRVAVATPEDVLVGDGESFLETGFGPATAVGFHEGLVAAGDGRIARYADEERGAGKIEYTDGNGDGDVNDTGHDGAWTTLATVDSVHAIDGELVAADAGVHRLDGTHLGLEDARDVSATADPLAATAAGLYYLGNGWMTALDGDFHVVAGHSDGRAHAATADAVHERSPDGEWTTLDLPVTGPVAAIGHADAIYAVTWDGTFLTNAGDGWRHRSLGLPDVAAIAVSP
jgi:hypothetical protein